MKEKIIQFIRNRDYRFVKELGQGACGKTVLLRDDVINEDFVCKKYAPHDESERPELFANFLREIKLLHGVLHPNVVRVFNYYLYPNDFAGFILMEFVEGTDIEDYLTSSPEQVNELFLQVISGFAYLESNKILHRDIRPGNILVRKDGTVKIIDLGFGKRIESADDFDKSISLNWWGEPPKELRNGVYDYRTEVYFVGNLFSQIIQDNDIAHFKYRELLRHMCARDPEARVSSFLEVDRHIRNNKFLEIDFNETEKQHYRDFSSRLAGHITKIERGSKYREDIEKIETDLENIYRGFMLEETVPNSVAISRCFISGVYYYKAKGFPVDVVRDFLQLLKSATVEKKRIILANLQTKLDSIERYNINEPDDDEIPF